MKLTVDASVFVAASRFEEVHYGASRDFLRQVKASGCSLYCPALLLPECAAAIARPTGNIRLVQKLVALIENFSRLHLVPLDADLARRAAGVAQDARLRGADSVYVSVAEMVGCCLITWDIEVLEWGAATVRTLTPATWLSEQDSPVSEDPAS